jgi:hypothetical protein
MSPNVALNAGLEEATQILIHVVTHYSTPCRRSELVRLQMRSSSPAYCDSDLQRLVVQSCLYLQRDIISLNHGIPQALGQRQAVDP